MSIGVAGAGLAQQLELIVGEGRQGAAQLPCQIRTARAVAGIPVLVRPPSVVEEGEQVDHQRIGSCGCAKRLPFSSTRPPVWQPVDSHKVEKGAHWTTTGPNLP